MEETNLISRDPNSRMLRILDDPRTSIGDVKNLKVIIRLSFLP